MERSSAPKREHEKNEDAWEPAAKALKLSFELTENPIAATGLSVDAWLDIFDFLEPKDHCAKKLSEVCKTFYNICSPRLRLLRFNFDKIYEQECYPVLKRAYTEIRITGIMIDYNLDSIGKALESSRETARKLFIGSSFYRDLRTKIKMRTLLFILRFLPSLEEVELQNVEALWGTSDNKINASELSKLHQSRKLTISYTTPVALRAFSSARGIKELNLSVRIWGEERKSHDKFLTKQKKLRIFRSNAAFFHKDFNFKELQFFNARIRVEDIKRLLESSSKLEHIDIIAGSRYSPLNMPLATLIDGPPIASLKTYICNRSITNNFDIDLVRKKFPSLEHFKDSQINWTDKKGFISR